MKDTGGPAFPHSRLGSDADGMTLRDYFAAVALQVVLPSGSSRSLDMWAEAAYKLADAMLKARQS